MNTCFREAGQNNYEDNLNFTNGKLLKAGQLLLISKDKVPFSSSHV